MNNQVWERRERKRKTLSIWEGTVVDTVFSFGLHFFYTYHPYSLTKMYRTRRKTYNKTQALVNSTSSPLDPSAQQMSFHPSHIFFSSGPGRSQRLGDAWETGFWVELRDSRKAWAETQARTGQEEETPNMIFTPLPNFSSFHPQVSSAL